MRRPQRLLQLRKAVPVILPFQIALDGLHILLESLHPRIEADDHLVEFAKDVGVAGFAFGALAADFADDVVGCVVDELDAAA